MSDRTILHYKINEKLGEGGMGVVSKAEDTKLKRDVAIKFLPRQIAASDEERERIKIEAQAAAALNHQKVAHVYAVDEVDGQALIAGIFLSRCMRENHVEKEAYTQFLRFNLSPSSLSSGQVMLRLHALASQFSGYIQTLFFIP